VTEVPALLTNGSAAHCRVAAQGKVTNFPPAHWAKAVPTQAFSPSVQGESAVRVANFALSACASLPFCKVKGFAPAEAVVEDGAGAADETTAAGADATGADAATALAVPSPKPAAAELLPASVAPVAEMRASLSAAVVQVMLVPALFTSGSAAQIVPPEH